MTEFNTVDEILRILREDLGIKDENIDTEAVAMTEFNHAGDCSICVAGSHICDCGEFHRAMPEIDVVDEESKELLVAHQCQVRQLTNDYILACHIRDVYEDYVKMLGEEIVSLAVIACVHGWKSENEERGRELRARIEEANKLIE